MQQPTLPPKKMWGRRGFLELMGGSAAATAATAGGLRWAAAGARSGQARWAFAGCAGKSGDPRGGRIRAYAVGRRGWTQVASVVSKRPAALVARGHFLYAANEIDLHRGLPQATVEAYRIGAQGQLTLLDRRPLSLSGTGPRHLAVSPDGRNLAVAVTGGGAYNLIPVAADGRLGPVAAILKETGSGPNASRQDAAHPRGLAFAPDGVHLLAADLGADRVNVLEVRQGAEGGSELRAAQRLAAAPGSGPSQLALHPNGRLLYVASELDGSLSGFAYDPASGRISGRRCHLPRLPEAGLGPMRLAVHPSGRFLFVSYPSRGASGDRVAVWRIAPASGRLQPVSSGAGTAAARFAALTPVRDRLYALDFRSGRVVAWTFDAATGSLENPVTVARPAAPLSLALV